MKTLNLTHLDLAPLQSCDIDIRIEVQGAIVEYYFNGEIPTFSNVVSEVAFNAILPTLKTKIARSNAGSNGKGTPKTNRKQNENKSKTKAKQNENKMKTNVADTQSVTSDFSKSCENKEIKETENKEEIEVSSPDPILQDKEEKKDKEKKERYEREDEQEGMTEDEFFARMKVHYPRVMAMRQPLTYAEYKRLVQEYGFSVTLIKDILEDMENYADLHKKFVSANLTLHKWIKIRQK